MAYEKTTAAWKGHPIFFLFCFVSTSCHLVRFRKSLLISHTEDLLIPPYNIRSVPISYVGLKALKHTPLKTAVHAYSTFSLVKKIPLLCTWSKPVSYWLTCPVLWFQMLFLTPTAAPVKVTPVCFPSFTRTRLISRPSKATTQNTGAALCMIWTASYPGNSSPILVCTVWISCGHFYLNIS